ncbi:tryptophan-rich sensory protein [Deinococcus apachensis]|uniref:tryptophan-rich sensory protein n=1 Tax=Deinococcus apachensis TaxID=309886 RepID=UPI00035EB6B5|nr:TspO/MBR family protein [Deinococcus apachensis]
MTAPVDSPAAPPMRWRWYHGLAFYLAQNAVGYILGELVSQARGTPGRSRPSSFGPYFKSLRNARFAPPSEAFLPVWAVNNASAIYGLLRALNRPRGTRGRDEFLTLQALSWLDLVIWNAAYFAVRSPIHGLVLTVLLLVFTIASVWVAAFRLRDSQVALSLATLFIWLTLASPVAFFQMLWNRDDLYGVGPFANPDPRFLRRGAGREDGRNGQAAPGVHGSGSADTAATGA